MTEHGSLRAEGGLTRKGELTRAAILDAALRLFAERGYQGATMRDIAREAGCSLGLAYRYFSRKEELVLAFYLQCADELEEEVRRIPAGPLASRFEKALRADIGRVSPYRGAFGALFGVALAPESEVAVLGDSMAHVRERVWSTFLLVVEGAADAPRGRQARDVATIFYGIHLGLVLFWLQDRSPDQKATSDLVALIRDMVKLARPALRLPPVSRLLARVARVITPMFGPASAR
jgi:AcrR family transcriptional regulator